MEDLDPAREPPEAAGQILSTLEAFGLTWDGDVLYQSHRLQAYQEALDTLRKAQLIYACTCSRQHIQTIGGVYDGHCRHLGLAEQGAALRVRVDDLAISVEDRIQGRHTQALLRECGDFILVRKDGLFAYQLAVVVDDARQGITHVVRGSDLLESTARQRYLQQCLGYHTPVYAHIPVAVNDEWQKLSKQHFADPIRPDDPVPQLHRALRFLGQNPPPELLTEDRDALLAWAIGHWDIQAVPKLANIRLDSR